MESNLKTRERVLRHLRAAVHHQIKLWDAARALSDLRGLELAKVLSVVEAQSITSDTGLDLTAQDLDDFLVLEPDLPDFDQRPERPEMKRRYRQHTLWLKSTGRDRRE